MLRRALLLGMLALLSLPLFPAVATQDDQPLIRAWQAGEWRKTDFSRHSIALSEIISGGPPRDGIPPIDRPEFVSVAEAARWLEPREPVMVLEHGGEARAYPLQILIWHEIVNDRVGGKPVVITYCPLCNSALAFERQVESQVLDFGTTGKLRHSDLVMWDRQTESWWQQLTGEAIVGSYTGTRLKSLPAPLVAFDTFRRAFPHGQVLSRETGHRRPYGNNPYVAYDSPGSDPFLFRGRPDPRLRPMERVVALEQGGQSKAYPYARLAQQGLAEDDLGGLPYVIFYEKGARSALDQSVIADSREVGAVGVFRRNLNGRALRFRRVSEGFRDQETDSLWNLLGISIAGPLRGQRLTPVPHGNPFAFAWFAFHPESLLWDGG